MEEEKVKLTQGEKVQKRVTLLSYADLVALINFHKSLMDKNQAAGHIEKFEQNRERHLYLYRELTHRIENIFNP